MTQDDILNKNLVLITYLQTLTDDYIFKAEYSTNDNDTNVIVVQEESGDKVVFFDDINPLFNYYNISIYGDSIKSEKDTSVLLGGLIGNINVSKELLVLIYTYGDGFTNTLFPTSPVLLIALSITGMSYFKWIKKSSILFGIIAVLVCLFLVLAYLLKY